MDIRVLIVLTALLTIAHPVCARVHQFETTRLKSTGGAGVASVLSDEATILNPAPMAMFNTSAVYLQRYTSEFQEIETADSTNHREENFGVIASDGGAQLNGALSFFKQQEWQEKRQQFNMALASSVGERSSMGFLFRYTRDKNIDSEMNLVDDSYKQVSVGALHALSENLTIGMVGNDLMNAKREDGIVLVGLQYHFPELASLIIDGGANYHEDLNETFILRTALQMRFFSDLFFRVGSFNDKHRQEKGSGIGLGWVTPNFVLEGGIKTTRFNYSDEKIAGLPFYAKKLKEASLSLGIKF